MKAAFIADVHIGPSSYFKGVRRKLTEYSETYISEFVQNVSESLQYSFALQLGDLIQDANRETDIKNFQKGINLFSECPCPFHHLVGNHDTIHMTPNEVGNILGYERLYYSFDTAEAHVVILYSHVPVPKQPRIVIQMEQLEWLRSDLAGTERPSIVFMHHSLADQDLVGNPWFEGRPDECLVENRKEVREVLASSDKVIAVVNGHLHWNRVDIHDGIPYVTVQSAIENFVGDGMPANSWGFIELKSGIFRIEVFGNDSAEFEYEFSSKAGERQSRPQSGHA